jgi:hypothetical protein
MQFLISIYVLKLVVFLNICFRQTKICYCVNIYMLLGSVFKAYKLITLTCIILFIYVGDYNDITILPLT